jgi:hypothetical protein
MPSDSYSEARRAEKVKKEKGRRGEKENTSSILQMNSGRQIAFR